VEKQREISIYVEEMRELRGAHEQFSQLGNLASFTLTVNFVLSFSRKRVSPKFAFSPFTLFVLTFDVPDLIETYGF
jgi:hypothetical protein